MAEMIIDGERVKGGGRDELPLYNPATGDVVGSVPVATPHDIERAAQASAIGFDLWRNKSAFERGMILRKGAAMMRQRTADLAASLTREQGKTIAEATGEIIGSADLIEWLADEGRRVYGRIVPARDRRSEQLVLHEPIGPVAAFSPWNYPVSLATRKIGHALAAGCSIVIKPAEEAPSAVVDIAQILIDAGVPAAALQVVLGKPADISSQLIQAPEIRKISFTGSIPVGRILGRLAGEALKPVTFELGGHAPVIVAEDANIDRFLKGAVAAKFRNAGQICISPTRFFVHASIYDEAVRRFADLADALIVGDGMDPKTQMGPLAHARRPHTMEGLVENAISTGARMVKGGPGEGKGFFWKPTVLSDVGQNAAAMREEPFGPLALFAPYDDLDDVIARANGTGHGLAAYVFANNLGTVRRLQDELRAGMVGINTFNATLPEMPLVGVGDSGIGAAMGSEGLLEHMAIKSVFRVDA